MSDWSAYKKTSESKQPELESNLSAKALAVKADEFLRSGDLISAEIAILQIYDYFDRIESDFVRLSV